MPPFTNAPAGEGLPGDDACRVDLPQKQWPSIVL